MRWTYNRLKLVYIALGDAISWEESLADANYNDKVTETRCLARAKAFKKLQEIVLKEMAG